MVDYAMFSCLNLTGTRCYTIEHGRIIYMGSSSPAIRETGLKSRGPIITNKSCSHTCFKQTLANGTELIKYYKYACIRKEVETRNHPMKGIAPFHVCQQSWLQCPTNTQKRRMTTQRRMSSVMEGLKGYSGRNI